MAADGQLPRQVRLELAEGLEAGGHVRNVVVPSRHPHRDAVKVVGAHCGGEAAQEVSDERAAARHLIDGVDHRSVVDPEPHEAIPEPRTVLLGGVDHGAELFESNVRVRDGRGQPCAPVECGVIHIPPTASQLAGRVRLQRHDRQYLVGKPDPRALRHGGELVAPPAGVDARLTAERDDVRARAQRRGECRLQVVQEGASPAHDAGGEAEFADVGLKGVRVARARAREPGGDGQQLLASVVADAHLAVDAVDLVPDEREDARRALLLVVVAPEAEPAEGGEREVHGGLALLDAVRDQQAVVDVHDGADPVGGEELNDLAGEGTREGRRQFEAERQPRVRPVRRSATVPRSLEVAPLGSWRALPPPPRSAPRVVEHDLVPVGARKRERGEELGDVRGADLRALHGAEHVDGAVDALDPEPPVRHARVQSAAREVEDGADRVRGAGGLPLAEVGRADDAVHGGYDAVGGRRPEAGLEAADAVQLLHVLHLRVPLVPAARAVALHHGDGVRRERRREAGADVGEHAPRVALGVEGVLVGRR